MCSTTIAERGPHQRLVPAEQHLAATAAEEPRAQREAEHGRDREQAERDEAGGARDKPGDRDAGRLRRDHPAGTGEVRVVACEAVAPPFTTTSWLWPFLPLTTTAVGIVGRARRGLRARPGQDGEHGEERPGREDRCPDVAHLSLPARRATAEPVAAGVMVWPTCGTVGAAGTRRVRPATAAAPVNAVAASAAASANSERRLGVSGQSVRHARCSRASVIHDPRLMVAGLGVARNPWRRALGCGFPATRQLRKTPHVCGFPGARSRALPTRPAPRLALLRP